MLEYAYDFNQDLSGWNVAHIPSEPVQFANGVTGWTLPKPLWGQQPAEIVVPNKAYHYPLTSASDPTNADWRATSAPAGYEYVPGYGIYADEPITSGWDMFLENATFNDPEIVNWDVSTITNMESMFKYAESFDQDLSNWDVSNVTNMKEMFNYAYAFNNGSNDATVEGIGGWDVSNVTTMNEMFYEATSFNRDINGWDVSGVTDMFRMFRNADAFNQDLDEWNTSSVTDMSYMFYSADAFDGNINTWNTGSVTNMEFMFAFADLFNQPLDNWDVSSVTTMESMFEDADSFNQDLNSWDVSNVTIMTDMFQYNDAFNGNISSWDVGNVTDMSEMFEDTVQFNRDLSLWYPTSIPTTPSDFDNGADNWTKPRPNWGQTAPEAPDPATIETPEKAYYYPLLGLPADPTSVRWRLNNAPAGYEFVPWSGIYADAPITSAENMFSRQFGAGTFLSTTEYAHTNPGSHGVVWAPDGSHIYSVKTSSVEYFSLSTPWDLSTVTIGFGTDGLSTRAGMYGGSMSPDGSKLFLLNLDMSIDEYTLSTPFEISTGTLTNTLTVLSNGTDPGVSNGFGVSLDGTVIVVIDQNDLIHRYDLSTAWDTTTASFVSTISRDVDGVTVALQGIAFTADGLQMVDAAANHWTLTTAYDLTTATYVGQITDAVVTNGSSPFISADGTIFAMGDHGASYFDAVMDDKFVVRSLTFANDFSVYPTQPALTSGHGFYEWDISTITTMKGMFDGQSLFDDILTGWNSGNVGLYGDWGVNSVTDTSFMFRGCSSFNQDLGYFRTINVTTMESMFEGCSSLVKAPTNYFSTDNATTLKNMFKGCEMLSDTGFLFTWDTSNVTDMSGMFYGCGSLVNGLTAIDADGNVYWNTSNVTDMSFMFYGCNSFNPPALAIYEWDVSNVTNMESMFHGARIFNAPLAQWNTSSVTNMHNMFYKAFDFNQDISAWNVSSVTNMEGMFREARYFNQDISGWNTSSVTDMGYMFAYTLSYNQPLNTWDVSSVTNMKGMFGRSLFFNQDLDEWNTSSVTDMSYMFDQQPYIAAGGEEDNESMMAFNGNITTWDTGNVTTMEDMFEGCDSFNQDLSGWNVSLIPSEPQDFAIRTSSWDLPKPFWGTNGVA
jgi:surface protein